MSTGEPGGVDVVPETIARVWGSIDAGRPPSGAEVDAVIDGWRGRWGEDGASRAHAELRSAVLGLGPLAGVIEDEQVTDVLVNGDGQVWIDRGAGVERAGVHLEDAAQVRRLATRLAALAGQRLDDAQPWVDGVLPEGIRLHAVLPPLVEHGAHLSLRVPRHVVPGLDQLREWGAMDGATLELLQRLVVARVSFLVTGGTGTGKTTLLAALLATGPPGERVVVIEDVREIQVRHPHVVRLQARAPNVEGRGEVSLATLVRQALRMRPDRLVVGEVRGPEVRELLIALNTGHEGGCGTVHANTAGDVVTRLEALAALAGMSPTAAHAQIRSAFRAVIHLERTNRRRVTEIGVLTPGADRPEVLGAWVYRAESDRWEAGPGWSTLNRLLGATMTPVTGAEASPP